MKLGGGYVFNHNYSSSLIKNNPYFCKKNNKSEIKYELNLIVQKGSNYISLFLPPPPRNNLDLFTLSREELAQLSKN